MKALKILLLILPFGILFSCQNNSLDVISNANVDRYINLLKANKYDSITLPAFSSNEIPALLMYRNDTQLISHFPYNPISSMMVSECKLGIYVLWTIESIRATSINSEYLIMRFPSQTPVLVLKDSQDFQTVIDDTSFIEVANAYYNWWQNNKQKDFNDFKNIDPLVNTKYKWH